MPIGGLDLTVYPQSVGEKGEGRVAVPPVAGGELSLDSVGSSRNSEGLHCDESECNEYELVESRVEVEDREDKSLAVEDRAWKISH